MISTAGISMVKLNILQFTSLVYTGEEPVG